MTEQEEVQDNSPDSHRQGRESQPRQSQAPDDASQPEYGQFRQPEYGAMSAQLPADYNPYVFGAPEQTDTKQQADGQASPLRTLTGQGQQPGYGIQQSPSGNAGGNGSYNPGNPGWIDFNDPQQNPWFGHWDPNAIVAFVFSLLEIPLLPAVIGIFSIIRIKKLHMKGIAFAVAAVIINGIVTLVWLWLLIHGLSFQDILQSTSGGGSGNGNNGDNGGGTMSA